MIIYRYLGRQIATVMLTITGILIAMIVSNQFVHYLRHAYGEHLLMSMVVKLALLQIPMLSGFILPLGFFLGILLCYGRMYSESEMTVLYSCGLSRLRLLGMTMSYAAVTAILVACLTFYLQPKLFWYQGEMIYKAKASSALQMLPPGVFEKIAKKWVFYASDMAIDHSDMTGIFAARLPKNKDDKWQVVVAARAKQMPDKSTGGGQLLLTNGRQYLGAPGEAAFQQVSFDHFHLTLSPERFSKKMLERHRGYLPTATLWQRRHTDPRAVAELQLRAAMPLSVFVLTLIAIPLSRVRARRLKHAQLLPAIVIYSVYMNLLFLARVGLKTAHISASVGMWWVHGLFILLGCVLWWRFVEARIPRFKIRGFKCASSPAI